MYLYLCSLYTQITKLTYVLKKPYTHVENIAGLLWFSLVWEKFNFSALKIAKQKLRKMPIYKRKIKLNMDQKYKSSS